MTSKPRWRNVFVLCTGRCGSTTFVRAAEHITNFTAGHETRTHLTGMDRFAYPPQHIEADNRLSWLLGRLDRHYGPNAFYVHLSRDPDTVAASFVKRADKGIMHAYRTEILMRARSRNKTATMHEFALDYIDTIQQNILLFLRDKPNQMAFHLEYADQQFMDFWGRIDAQGDSTAALAEFSVRHNASVE